MPAQAAPINYVFSGSTVSDGGPIAGSFTYDAAINLYADISITVTPSDTLSFPAPLSFEKVITTGAYASSSTILFAMPSIYDGVDATGLPFLFLVFTSPLTDMAGTISISGNGGDPDYSPSIGYCLDSPCYGATSPYEFGSSSPGVVIGTASVPEPFTSGLLMVSAMIAMGLCRRAGPARAAAKQDP